MPAAHHDLTPAPPLSQPHFAPDFGADETPEITLTRGRARRSKSFAGTLKQAEEFTGAPLFTRRIMRAILRAGDITYTRDDGTTGTLTDGARLLLLDLLDRVPDYKWESGEPFAWPCNDTLADDQGRTVRCIQGRIADLEEAGLTVRHYDYANGRLNEMGFDLRPLAAWLEGAEAEIAQKEQRRFAARQARRIEYLENDSGDPESPCTQIYNSKYPSNLSTENPENVNPENNQAEGAKAPTSHHAGRSAAGIAAPIGATAHQERGGEVREWAFLDDLAARQWVDLFAEYSPTFRTNLEARCAPFGLLGAAAADVAAVIDDIIKAKLPDMNRDVWSYGLRRHGMLAIAALLVAADKPGILKGRPDYLSGILRKAPDDPTFDPLRGLRSLNKPARRLN